MQPVLLFLTACAASVVFASPHGNHVARHHAIVARAPAVVAAGDDAVLLKKRQSNKRCKNRSSSSVATSSTTVDVKSAHAKQLAQSSTPTPKTTPNPPVNNNPPPPPPPKTTTTTPPPPPTPTPTPPTSNTPSFMAGVQTGQGTFYDAGLGACGTVNSGSDFIVAVSWRLFDNFPGYNGVNPNTNPICGKKIRATYEGKSVDVTVTDRCADDTCLLANLDFSRAAFQQIADLALGRLHGVRWVWI